MRNLFVLLVVLLPIFVFSQKKEETFQVYYREAPKRSKPDKQPVADTMESSFQKKIIITKTLVFEGTDYSFLENEELIERVSPSLFAEIVKTERENCMYADTVIFYYNPNNWERGIIVKLHSNLTQLPLHFEVTHVGTTFQALINVIEENFVEIKSTMKRQEMAASKGDPNYEKIE